MPRLVNLNLIDEGSELCRDSTFSGLLKLCTHENYRDRK